MAETSKDFQAFLDQNQYTARGILKYEKIFGRGFVSTGGMETTQVINFYNIRKYDFVQYLKYSSRQEVYMQMLDFQFIR